MVKNSVTILRIVTALTNLNKSNGEVIFCRELSRQDEDIFYLQLEQNGEKRKFKVVFED